MGKCSWQIDQLRNGYKPYFFKLEVTRFISALYLGLLFYRLSGCSCAVYIKAAHL